MAMKKIVLIVAGVLAVVVGAPFVYINLIRDEAPDRLSLENDAPSTSTGEAPSGSVEGRWRATSGSQVGYRVNEVIAGQRAAAVGRTNKVTGTMTIAGTTVTTVDLSADMTSVSSDESLRDGQFRGRIMDVSRFPTATFKLAEPLSLSSIPNDSSTIKVSAVGDLTLRGTTKRVTVPLDARRNGARIEVSGAVPIVFADWGIPNPSFGPVSTEDRGELELLVVFERA